MPQNTPSAYRNDNATPTATPDTTSAYRTANATPTLQMRNQTSFHRDAYAIQQRISWKNITRLARASYHHRPYGISSLNERILIECGYTTDSHHGLAEVMICYNNIIAIHRTVFSNWSNDRYGTSGPQLNRIVVKELAVFPRLISTSAEEVVGFYYRLHEMSAP